VYENPPAKLPAFMERFPHETGGLIRSLRIFQIGCKDVDDMAVVAPAFALLRLQTVISKQQISYTICFESAPIYLSGTWVQHRIQENKP